MNNCRKDGSQRGFGNGSRGNHGGCGHHGRGRFGGCPEGEHRGHGGRNGGGKKRELFIKKYGEYMKTVNLPDFETDEQYCKWLSESDEGKVHAENIKRINAEIDEECPWGGKRENSGRRKECIRKIPYTRRISPDLLQTLKNYAKEHNMTETEALEKAISSLK